MRGRRGLYGLAGLTLMPGAVDGLSVAQHRVGIGSQHRRSIVSAACAMAWMQPMAKVNMLLGLCCGWYFGIGAAERASDAEHQILFYIDPSDTMGRSRVGRGRVGRGG